MATQLVLVWGCCLLSQFHGPHLIPPEMVAEQTLRLRGVAIRLHSSLSFVLGWCTFQCVQESSIFWMCMNVIVIYKGYVVGNIRMGEYPQYGKSHSLMLDCGYSNLWYVFDTLYETDHIVYINLPWSDLTVGAWWSWLWLWLDNRVWRRGNSPVIWSNISFELQLGEQI